MKIKLLVVLGIIIIFSLSYLGISKLLSINEENKIKEIQNIVYADALSVESSCKLYCHSEECGDNEELEWSHIDEFGFGFDLTEKVGIYEQEGVICKKVGENFEVHLERVGTGEYEFKKFMVPSQENPYESVIIDVD